MKPQDPARLLHQSVQAHQQGRLDIAEAGYRQVLQQLANQPDAWRLLGQLQLAQTRWAEAAASLSQSIRARPQQAEAWHALGEAQEELQHLAEAEASYRRAGELRPGWPEAHYNQARLLRMLEQTEPARLALKRSLDLNPSAVAAWQLRALLEQDAGELVTALKSLDQALHLAPERAAFHHNRAVLLQRLHRHAEALAAHERALGLGLQVADAHYNHGNTLQSLGRSAAAAAAYRQALKLDGQHGLALYDLARLRYSQGEPDFLAELDAAETAAPQSALAPGLKAQLLLKAERPSEAADAYARACRLAPQSCAYFDGLGQALSRLGRHEDALQAQQHALQLNPSDANTRSNLARSLLAAGRAAEAAAMAEQALRHRPDDQLAVALLGLAWRLLGDPREAWLNDYGSLVQVFDLPAPPGWAGMTEFNQALTAELNALHTDREAPVDQTLRHGTQTHDNLLDQAWPRVAELKPVLSAAIRRYIAGLPEDSSHPFLQQRSADWHFTDSWSSRLRSSGFHTNHVHGHGWISACYYVALPEATVDAEAQAGWIKFGQPDLDLGLAPQRLEQPRVGRLVLFPSCFWHGTTPFVDVQPRLTIAFDVKPD